MTNNVYANKIRMVYLLSQNISTILGQFKKEFPIETWTHPPILDFRILLHCKASKPVHMCLVGPDGDVDDVVWIMCAW